MSLSKLPDLVKSQICTFLNFNDIKKLEQTNKKTQFFLKRYKLDKPWIYRLSCYQYVSSNGLCIECSVQINMYDKWIDLPGCGYHKDQNLHSAMIMNTINKFRSIGTLSLDNFNLQDGPEWESVKTKISYGFFHDIMFISTKESVVNFLKHCKCDIVLSGDCFDPKFINDQLFTDLNCNGRNLGFRRKTPLEVNVTDMTLDTLSKIYLPGKICLQGLTTEFTLEGIKKMIEVSHSTETLIKWNLGFMKVEMFHEVDRFIQEEFKEWCDRLKMPLYVEHSMYCESVTESFEPYTIYHREKECSEYSITFAVKKPEELIQKIIDEDAEEDAIDV